MIAAPRESSVGEGIAKCSRRSHVRQLTFGGLVEVSTSEREADVGLFIQTRGVGGNCN